MTRSEYLAANSASKVKPWVALGMKRSWYYELKKRGELDRTGPSENASRSYTDNSSVTDLSVTPVQSVAPAFDRGPPEAGPRQPPSPSKYPIVVPPHAVILEGEIITGGRARDSRPETPKINRHVLSALARAYAIQREEGRR